MKEMATWYMFPASKNASNNKKFKNSSSKTVVRSSSSTTLADSNSSSSMVKEAKGIIVGNSRTSSHIVSSSLRQ